MYLNSCGFLRARTAINSISLRDQRPERRLVELTSDHGELETADDGIGLKIGHDGVVLDCLRTDLDREWRSLKVRKCLEVEDTESGKAQ